MQLNLVDMAKVLGCMLLGSKRVSKVADPARAALGYDQSVDLWSLGVVLPLGDRF